MARDVSELHDYLWSPKWSGDEVELRSRVLSDAKDLDGFIGAGGALTQNTEALTKDWGRGPAGEALFELLNHTYSMTAARELLKAREYQDAAEEGAKVAESSSIGVCAAAGCFDLVEDWERGGGDFETYTMKLSQALEGKDIPGARDFGRLLLAAGRLGKEWDGEVAAETQALTAKSVIANAAWCAATAVRIRQALGAAPTVPYADLPGLVRRISFE